MTIIGIDHAFGSYAIFPSGSQSTVPEPGTLVLFGAVALGYGVCRRRRKASSSAAS